MRAQTRKTDPKPGSTLCASARSGSAHGHVTRQEPFGVEIHRKLRGNLKEKCRSPIPRDPGSTFCASLRSRNAHGHFTRSILCGNFQEKCRTRIPGPAFSASPGS